MSGLSATAAKIDLRVGPAHQEDLLARGALPVRVRPRAGGTVRLRAQLRRGDTLTPLTKKTVRSLPRGRWSGVALPLTPAGRSALARCEQGRIEVQAGRGHGKPRTVATKLRLGPPGCRRFFSASTFWNTPIDSAPLDPSSDAVTAQLRRQVEDGLRTRTARPTINTFISAPPIVTVPADQPHVRVQLDRPRDYAPELARAFESVPLPPTAKPSAGTDSELIVWQPATDTFWEFWLLRRATDGWHAKWGGRLRGVSGGPGLFTESREAWGESASGLPLAGGVITPAELRSGVIDHALGLGIPRARAGAFALPASRTDGVSKCRDAVPEGARFRLDPALDVESLGLPRPVAAMARAAQRYGIVVRDQAGAVAFYAQNVNSLASDPYPALFEGRTPQELVARFPWDHLQLVQMELRWEKGHAPPPLGGFLEGCP